MPVRMIVSLLVLFSSAFSFPQADDSRRRAADVSHFGGEPAAPTVAVQAAASPVVQLTPTSLDAGPALLGSFSCAPGALPVAQGTVTINNTGTANLNISNVSVVGSDFELFNCGHPPFVPQVLIPGATGTLTIALLPSVSGMRNGTLVIQDDAADSPQQVPLTGVGVGSGDFGVGAASGSDSATVTAGQTATYQLNVAAGSGVVGIIKLNCSNLPMGTACSASPAPIAVNGPEVMKATLSVSTTAHNGALLHKTLRHSGLWWSLAAVLGFVLIRRPRRVPKMLASLIALGIMGFLLSCGGGGSSGQGPQGATPAGTFSFTVTATSGSNSHSTQFTMIVQ